MKAEISKMFCSVSQQKYMKPQTWPTQLLSLTCVYLIRVGRIMIHLNQPGPLSLPFMLYSNIMIAIFIN